MTPEEKQEFKEFQQKIQNILQYHILKPESYELFKKLYNSYPKDIFEDKIFAFYILNSISQIDIIKLEKFRFRAQAEKYGKLPYKHHPEINLDNIEQKLSEIFKLRSLGRITIALYETFKSSLTVKEFETKYDTYISRYNNKLKTLLKKVFEFCKFYSSIDKITISKRSFIADKLKSIDFSNCLKPLPPIDIKDINLLRSINVTNQIATKDFTDVNLEEYYNSLQLNSNDTVIFAKRLVKKYPELTEYAQKVFGLYELHLIQRYNLYSSPKNENDNKATIDPKKTKETYTEKGERLVKAFFKGDVRHLNQFCEDNKIQKDSFFNFFKNINFTDPYTLLMIDKCVLIAQKVISLLDNSNFDAIEYYRLFDINLEVVSKLIGSKMSKTDLVKFGRFKRKYSNNKVDLRDPKITQALKKDFFSIDDDELYPDLLNKIIKFIIKNNLPQTIGIFAITYKRIKDGTADTALINLEDQKVNEKEMKSP